MSASAAPPPHFKYVRGLDSFRNFSDGELTALLNVMKAVKAPPGTTLIREGDAGTSCFLLVKGKVALYKEQDVKERRFLAHVQQGGLFGLVALIDGMSRSATAVAVEPCEMLELPKQVFDKLFFSGHPVGYRFQLLVAEALAKQLRHASVALKVIAQSAEAGEDLSLFEATRSLDAAQAALEEYNMTAEEVVQPVPAATDERGKKRNEIDLSAPPPKR